MSKIESACVICGVALIGTVAFQVKHTCNCDANAKEFVKVCTKDYNALNKRITALETKDSGYLPPARGFAGMEEK